MGRFMIIRMTKQRRIILDELSKLKSHPTAEELYTLVKKRLPNVSLGTVYRNLMQMSSDGDILRLDGGDKMRFDADKSAHAHLRCKSCGKVLDVTLRDPNVIGNLATEVLEHDVSSVCLEFFGTCCFCKKQDNC